MSGEDAMGESPDDAAVRATELERRLVELEAESRDRLIRAELKMEAVRAGMVDLDGLKLADPAGVSVDEAGEVQGAARVMQALRRAKPWLFIGASASSAATPPPAQVPRTRLATEMSTEDWLAARADLLRRR